MPAIDQLRRIQKARVRMLLKYPFYGHLCLHLEPTARPSLVPGTMANDGAKLYYDPDGAMKDWTDDELVAVIVHETLHAAFGHLWRRGNRNPIRWNVACDYVINGLIDQDGLTLPKGCCLDHKYDGMSSEQVYALLPESLGKITIMVLDDADLWEQITSGQGSGQDGQDDGDTVIVVGPGDGKNSTQQEQGQQDGSGDQPSNGPLIWKERVAQAATAAKVAGKLPGHIQEMVEDLLQPRVNWRELLRDYVQSSIKTDYRLCPPNKRFLWMPIYLPSLGGEHLEIAVGMDTSGSISHHEAQVFLSEIRSICEQFESYKIHLFQCDAAVHGYWEISNDEEPDPPHEVLGRGGTDFRPVFNEIQERGLYDQISCLVFLTDMYGPFPDVPPVYPVIWGSTSDIQGPFGTTIQIDIKQEVPAGV